MLGRFASSRKLNVSVNHISPVRSVVRAVAVPQEPPEPWYLPEEKIKTKVRDIIRNESGNSPHFMNHKTKSLFSRSTSAQRTFQSCFSPGEANNEKVSFTEKMENSFGKGKIANFITELSCLAQFCPLTMKTSNSAPQTFQIRSTSSICLRGTPRWTCLVNVQSA